MLRSLLRKLNDEVLTTFLYMQIFNSATKTVRKIHKVSGSYHKLFRNNLDLNLPQAKMNPPTPPGLIGLK